MICTHHSLVDKVFTSMGRVVLRVVWRISCALNVVCAQDPTPTLVMRDIMLALIRSNVTYKRLQL